MSLTGIYGFFGTKFRVYYSYIGVILIVSEAREIIFVSEIISISI